MDVVPNEVDATHMEGHSCYSLLRPILVGAFSQGPSILGTFRLTPLLAMQWLVHVSWMMIMLNDDAEEERQKRKWLLVTTDAVHNPPLLTALHHHPCKPFFEDIPMDSFYVKPVMKLVTTNTVHNPPLLTALHHSPCKPSFKNIFKGIFALGNYVIAGKHFLATLVALHFTPVSDLVSE